MRLSESSAKADIRRVPAISDRDDLALACHTHSPKTARRCRIVLLSLEGWSDAAIADHLDLPSSAVRWWRGQFEKEGIAGLIAPATTGRPTTRRPTASPASAARSPGFGHKSVSGPDGASVGGRWRSDVHPRLPAAAVELVGAYVSPRVQAAGLLEMVEPEAAVGRRAGDVPSRHKTMAGATSDGVGLDSSGSILWLTEHQSVAHQLGDFLQEVRRSARGRRVHVVTANAAVFTWIRSLRSRDTSLNLVAHLAVDSWSLLDLIKVWTSLQEDTSDGQTLGDTIRRLHGSGRRFTWFKPPPQALRTAGKART